MRFMQLLEIKINKTEHLSPISVTNLMKEVNLITVWIDEFP